MFPENEKETTNKFGIIDTIKIVRSFTSLGLVDAKIVAEEWMNAYGYCRTFNPTPDSISRLARLCRKIYDGRISIENGKIYTRAPITWEQIQNIVLD